MNNILESSNYMLAKSDETQFIDDINLMLNQYEILITSPDLNNKTILKGSLICEYILNIILQKRGFLIKNNASLKEIVEFSKENKIIPNPCCSFLNTIEIYRKNYNIEYPDNLTNSFLKAFAYYITWFNNSYSKNNLFNTNDCFNIINNIFDCKLFSIEDNDKNDNFSENNDVENKLFCPNCGEKIDNDSKFCPHCRHNFLKTNKNISNIEKIDENLILNLLEDENKAIDTILKTLNLRDCIDTKLTIISKNIHRIQSQSEKLIKAAQSEEEIDRIIEVHTTECVETIFEYKKDISQDPAYKQEENKLIDFFSHETWDKLSDDSKIFLITAKFMYNKFIKLDEIIDYSGVCILITKALEIEIIKRFFTNFIKFLDNNYNKNYIQYPTSLLYEGVIPLSPEKVTMGNIAFILCEKENWNDNEKQIKNNKERLLEYCRQCIFSNKSTEEIEKLLYSYVSSIEMIKIKYRNPSAHINHVQRKTAKECLDLLVDNQKLLKKILDSFDK